jgi:hypothetical protein
MEVGVRELTILSDRLSYSLVPPEKVSSGGSIILYQWLLCRKDGSNETRWKYLEELGISEMERDCMIAHGASRFLKERLFDCSDPYQIIVCNQCGMITASQTECLACKQDKVTTCNMPYAAKLLCQELLAMGIKVAIKPTL